MKKKLLIILLVTFSEIAFSQGAALDEIIVTGRSRSELLYDMPSVTVSKNADFLTQNIRLTNDSRSPDYRRTEIIQTINNLVNASSNVTGIEISYGDGFVVPITLNDESIELIDDRQKIDTSYVDIYVKVAYQSDLHPKEQIAALRGFVEQAEKAGRTEIIGLGDIGLSIVDPEQYRYEIIALIAEENQKMAESLGGECEISLSGLEGRVRWARAGVGELILYIPYGTEAECS